MKLSIDEFCIEELETVKEFTRYWLRMHKEDPDNYPYNLRPGDWDEQYHFFKEQRDNIQKKV